MFVCLVRHGTRRPKPRTPSSRTHSTHGTVSRRCAWDVKDERAIGMAGRGVVSAAVEYHVRSPSGARKYLRPANLCTGWRLATSRHRLETQFRVIDAVVDAFRPFCAEGVRFAERNLPVYSPRHRRRRQSMAVSMSMSRRKRCTKISPTLFLSPMAPRRRMRFSIARRRRSSFRVNPVSMSTHRYTQVTLNDVTARVTRTAHCLP